METTETPRGSHYVTAETARRAISLAAPMIEAARMDAAIVGSGFLYVVIMNPGMAPDEAPFERAILYEQGFGEEARWDADYRRMAREKAKASWRTGCSGHALQALSPHRLRRGDTLLWGAECIDGIVVGASGAFPWFDEVFAGCVALALRALAKQAREAERQRLRID